jgi:acetolactate synthase regulatory subunit
MAAEPAGAEPAEPKTGDQHMQTFHIRYRNTQGTLMRILNAASRRGLDLPAVQAEAAERDHQVTVVLEVNPKQVGQLCREWYSIADVIHVGSGAAHAAAWPETHPPAGVTIDESRAAARA